MRDMVWKVYADNFNGNKIEEYNIFSHYSFNEDVKKAYKKYKNDFEAFSKEVKSSLMYYFWSKCEWEILVGPWVGTANKDKIIKIDVYDQVMLNWETFIKYVWEQAHAKKTKSKISRGEKDRRATSD